MARYAFEEHSRVHWVPGESGIGNMDAPTVAEINAGTDLTCYITKDGLNPGGNQNKVESAGLCTAIDGQVGGSVSFDFSLKLFRDNAPGGDDAWDLAVRGSQGYIVVRQGPTYETAFAVGQKVEVYKAEMLEPITTPSAANTVVSFMLGFAIADKQAKATVA